MKPILLLLALILASIAPAQTLGIDITESTANNYDADVNQALRAGATATSLTLFWDDAMQGPTYQGNRLNMLVTNEAFSESKV